MISFWKLALLKFKLNTIELMIKTNYISYILQYIYMKHMNKY